MEFTAKHAKGAKIFYRSLRSLRPLRFSNCTGRKFVERYQAVLKTLPLAYFQVSGFLKEGTPERRQEAAAYLAPVRALVAPVSEGLFAGKMDYSKLSFIDRMIARIAGSVEGDWRDWDAIRAWAVSLRSVLGS